MKTVVKYCKAEHHYSKAKKFRLGTLQEYREHENKFIADPLEGLTPKYTIRNSDSTINLDGTAAKTLFAGAIQFRGSGTAVEIAPGATVKVNTHSLIPNQYIWCTADQECGKEETAHSLGYDSWYKIIDVDSFMLHLYFSMSQNIKFKIPMIYKYQVTMIHRPLVYETGKNFHSKTGIIDPLMDGIFSKPEKSQDHPSIDYTKNIEYRMLWLMYAKETGIVHAVKKEAIEFDFTSEMKSFCE
jgi:hypothetical protein